jgi:hypothetical protein
MKKFMTDKMWFILQICSEADGPLNANELSDKLIEVCLENKQYGFWGKLISHLGKPAINTWIKVVYNPGFLSDCLEELIFAGRIIAIPDSRHSDFRYSITARGRRSFRIFVRYNARSIRRKRKASLA